MVFRIERKNVEELNPTNVLPQTPFWARLKNRQGFFPTGFRLTVSKDMLNPLAGKRLNLQDDLLILIKYVDQTHCFAYVPYGPKLEPDYENQGVFLEVLSEVLKSCLPSNCVFIRYDLSWENQWAHEGAFFDKFGNWIGPPSPRIQEFRVNFNTENWKLKKSASDMLPKNTFFLDLTQTENDLLYNMRYNTRYNIRKAWRNGIWVEETEIEGLDEWYRLYMQTAIRNNLPLYGKAYFSALLRDQDMSKRGVTVRLLIAGRREKALAAMFLVLCNKRGTYLFGASSSNDKNLLASYALQWEGIKKSKKHGCAEYDMFGCAPNLSRAHPLHGVHIYKKGFGGHLYHRMGCWDYPYSEKKYQSMKSQENNN